MESGEKAQLILLVEDNASDEMLALRALKKANLSYVVEVARDGLAAVEFLLDPANAKPRLILLDLKLPKLNGLEVLQRVRADPCTRFIPVVIFTSSNEQADVLGCLENGANSFVRKAFEFNDYLDCVAKVAEYWLKINEPCERSIS